jgi:proteasome lid subunit RPN8/RPN11
MFVIIHSHSHPHSCLCSSFDHESLPGSRNSQLIYMEFTPIAINDNNNNHDNFAFYAAICEDGYYGLTK